MPDQLFGTSPIAAAEHTAEQIFVRLLISLAAGCIAMLVYRFARAGEPRNHSFEVTLVLLSVLIAMVTQVIGNSVARAFSLVGALSIVRFRTVVRDTQDTAYVIFAVVLGMAAGADLWMVAAIGVAIVFLAVLLMRKRSRVRVWSNEQPAVLEIRVPLGSALEQICETVFREYLESFQLSVLNTAKQGVALEATYNVRLKPESSPTDFVRALNKVEGVQSVALHSAAAFEK